MTDNTIAGQIGVQAKSIMELVNEIDAYLPDEDAVEVLMYAFGRWSAIEQSLLFPVVEQHVEESELLIASAVQRLEKLREMEDDMHLYEGAEAPFSETATKYIAAVKYHLIVDVQDILPLTLHIPSKENIKVAERMRTFAAE